MMLALALSLIPLGVCLGVCLGFCWASRHHANELVKIAQRVANQERRRARQRHQQVYRAGHAASYIEGLCDAPTRPRLSRDLCSPLPPAAPLAPGEWQTAHRLLSQALSGEEA